MNTMSIHSRHPLEASRQAAAVRVAMGVFAEMAGLEKVLKTGATAKEARMAATYTGVSGDDDTTPK